MNLIRRDYLQGYIFNIRDDIAVLIDQSASGVVAVYFFPHIIQFSLLITSEHAALSRIGLRDVQSLPTKPDKGENIIILI